MAGDPQTFIATVSDWVTATKERQLAVFHASSQTVVTKMIERTPIDTGFCRSSLVGSTEQMPQIDPNLRGAKGQNYTFNASEVFMVIAKATLTDTIYLGYTASYAGYLEYGHSKQAPAGFVGITAEEWPQIVSESSQQLMTRAQGEMG